MRFYANDGVWLLAFAFDPKKKAILLVAGNKAGTSVKGFYKRLIPKGDKRFDSHLQELKDKGE
ncbi:type II toxin-antitoxin system RelE/ParE family toxin [Trichormus azollae HNT15244]